MRTCVTEAARAKVPEVDGIDAYVTGTTAMNIDTNDKLAAALPKYIAVVVGLALILLDGGVPFDPGADQGDRGLPCSASPRPWASWSGCSRTAT